MAAEPAAKSQESMPSTPVKLDVKMVSGDTFASVQALSSWSVADVMKNLQPSLKSGTELSSLLYGSQQLQASKTLSECGLENGATLQAFIAAVPTLHVFEPCTGAELGGERGRMDTWIIGGDSEEAIIKPDVTFASMDTAPPEAKAVAEAMNMACPGLGDEQVCLESEGGSSGEVVVIANPGTDPKVACVRALAILEKVDDQPSEDRDDNPFSIIEKAALDKTDEDWSSYMKCGFNSDPDGLLEGVTSPGVIAITKVMAEKLTNGFVFNFTDEVVVAPMIFGGYASDGSIVGVLTSRVWTNIPRMDGMDPPLVY